MSYKTHLKESLKGYSPIYCMIRGAYGLSRSVRRLAYAEKATVNPYLVNFDTHFKHNFCGYYDHSPFMPSDESQLLVHSTNATILRNPDPRARLTVRVVDRTTGKESERLGHTYAWNWQQGSRALWVCKERWVFNFFDISRGDYGSIIGRIGSTERIYLPYPVQTVSPLGVFYSINYSVLAEIRPDYGYFNRKPSSEDFQNNGIKEICISGNVRTVVSVAFLKADAEDRMKQPITRFKVNHVLCSSAGNYIIFMFRYRLRNGRRVTDVYLYKRDHGTIDVLIADSNVSHYCWIDSETVTYTGHHEFGFGLYTVDVCHRRSGPMIGVSTDGHPCLVNGETLLLDTYPNELGLRSLVSLRRCADGTYARDDVLGSFVEPWYLWGQRRCDLHPSVSQSGMYWQVDVVTQGRRTVCIGDNHL